jgi:hypothetical protein
VSEAADIDTRVRALAWPRIEAALAADGFATTGPLLEAAQCAALAASYDDDAGFRSRVVMARHGYGRGEYRYFAYPLPALVGALRAAFYPPLAAIANRWMSALERGLRYPAAHDAFLARCRGRGQSRPTPLLLRYATGDYNCLHQDLYGEIVFPLQLTVLLSDPRRDFDGGEFVLATSRPRRQSRVDVVPLAQGEAVVFAVRERPEPGPRGPRRVTLRHGVSRLLAGTRHALGIPFHDAA